MRLHGCNPSDSPDNTLLKNFVFEIVSVLIYIRYKDAVIFFPQSQISCHNLPIASGEPHPIPPDSSFKFHMRRRMTTRADSHINIRNRRNRFAHRGDRPPFNQFIGIIETGKKMIYNLSSGNPPDF